MFIESIILHNYRAYKGHNKTSFKQDAKNIFLVAGNNGFGKTTFLTSLVWCLYGKLMVDVDEKFRRDINDAQGYKNYARQSLHKELASVVNTYEASPEVRKRIIKHGYSSESEYPNSRLRIPGRYLSSSRLIVPIALPLSLSRIAHTPFGINRVLIICLDSFTSP